MSSESTKEEKPAARDISSSKATVLEMIKLYPRVIGLAWRCDPKNTVFGFLLLILLAAVTPAQFWLSKQIIDKIIETVHSAAATKVFSLLPVWGFVGLQVLTWIAGSAMEALLIVVQSFQSGKLQHYVERLILEKAAGLDMAFFDSNDFFQRVEAVRNRGFSSTQGILMSFGSLLQGFLTLISMLAMIATLHPLAAACIFLLSLPGMYSAAYLTRRRFAMQNSQVSGRMNLYYLSWLLASRDAAKEIRLFSLQRLLFGRLDMGWKQFINENGSLVSVIQRKQIATIIPSLAATAGVWIYAVHQAILGQITVGAMAMYFQAAKSASDQLARLCITSGALYENSLFLTQLFGFLDMKPDSFEGTLRRSTHRRALSVPSGLPFEIEFRRVSFHYPGMSSDVLRDISFTISTGERVALVGPNGSGKTTLTKLMTRLYDPTEGEILLNGKNLEDYDLEEFRSLFGVLAQDFVRYHTSIRDNIGFGRASRMQDLDRIRKAAENAGCLPLIEKLPQQFDTELGRTLAKGVDLSGGEWQKIALARAFMRDAKILILDEPTAALDPQAEQEILGTIDQLMAGKACVVVSHRFSTVRSMERILVLRDGRLVEQGSHEDLIVSNGDYAYMLNIQAARFRDLN